MAIPYNEPGVTFRELESPTFSVSTSGAPTIPAIVGPSRGYRDVTDIVQLIDNAGVVLSTTGINRDTVRVVDAADPNGTAFVESTASVGDQDYTLTTDANGATTIRRTMQTAIADNETVVTYFENSGTPSQSDGKTATVNLDRLDAEFVDGNGGSVQSGSTQTASLKVQNRGQVSVDDYTIANEGSDSPVPTITYENTNGVVGKYQTLYLDYTIDGVDYVDRAVQLNNLTAVSLPAGADDILVKNAPGLGSTGLSEVTLYTKGTVDTEDYIVSGSGATLKIARSQGTTTIGGADDQLRVRVTYQAIPDNYWTPTRAFSPAEVEAKYGPALDSDGNISSPISFAAGLAFANGASEVVMQALFASGPTAPTGSQSDWTTTLQALRVSEIANVIVPIIGVGGSVVTSNDTLVSSAISAVKTHIDYMKTLGVYAIALCGTDSTTAGQGTQTARRALAQTFASEDVTILSPASCAYVNQLNRQLNIGGQYAAAAVAGMLCRYPVQDTMTRKTLVGITAVNEVVERAEKNRDAASGLTVLENVNGRVRVRHALTTDVSSVAKSELNVIRAKHHMLDVLNDVIDNQIVGNVRADEDAGIVVQAILDAALQGLESRGVVDSYAGLSAVVSTTNPTQVNVRFAYKPPFVINYVEVAFSIDLGQNSTSILSTATGA